MFRRFFLIIKIIIFSKKTFFVPSKKKIIVFDLESKPLISTLFFEDDVEYLASRFEEINIFILLKCFLKFRFGLLDYYVSYINTVNPSLVVTNIDTSIIFYRLKEKIRPKVVAIQRGYKTYHSDILTVFNDEEKKIKKLNLSLDTMFVFNKQIEKIFAKYIKAQYVIIGSANNNRFQIKKNITKENSLLYVSGFIGKQSNSDKYAGTNISYSEYMNSQAQFLNFLSKYAASKGKKIKILGKRGGDIKYKKYTEEEIEYFNNILKNTDYDFIEYSKNRPTFDMVDKSSIVIGISSCLLYESLSRKNKTFFCGFTPDKYPLNTKLFGYLSDFPRQGPFWYTGKDLKIYEKLLDELDAMDNDYWQNIIKKFTPEITFYNENNSILKNHFRQMGINVQQ